MARILGVDHGERRIGFAVSDEAGIIAMPLEVASVTGDTQALDAVRTRAAQYDPQTIVVGLPRNMDGSLGPQAQRVLAFVERLREDLRLPIETWDERLSSRQAERVLIEADASRAKRRQVLDKLSAQVVLQSYLDSKCRVGENEK